MGLTDWIRPTHKWTKITRKLSKYDTNQLGERLYTHVPRPNLHPPHTSHRRSSRHHCDWENIGPSWTPNLTVEDIRLTSKPSRRSVITVREVEWRRGGSVGAEESAPGWPQWKGAGAARPERGATRAPGFRAHSLVKHTGTSFTGNEKRRERAMDGEGSSSLVGMGTLGSGGRQEGLTKPVARFGSVSNRLPFKIQI
jgi:hypothetical protein